MNFEISLLIVVYYMQELWSKIPQYLVMGVQKIRFRKPQSPVILKKKRGVTLMTRIWTLLAHQKLKCALNGSGQPIGESVQTFKRWLGTFCLSHTHCPLVPVNWAHVPNNVKENAWVEIEVVTY